MFDTFLKFPSFSFKAKSMKNKVSCGCIRLFSPFALELTAKKSKIIFYELSSEMSNTLPFGVILLSLIDESVTVCDGKSHKISCLGDHKIKITAADYGRASKEVCPAFLFDRNTNCHSDNALEITQKECDGFPECTLYANTDEYGNPCLFTVEYLTVCP